MTTYDNVAIHGRTAYVFTRKSEHKAFPTSACSLHILTLVFVDQLKTHILGCLQHMELSVRCQPTVSDSSKQVLSDSDQYINFYLQADANNELSAACKINNTICIRCTKYNECYNEQKDR